MLSKGYYKVLALVHILAVTLFLSGCMGFNNKQLTSQLEGIDVSVYEDERGLIIALPTVYFDFDSSNLKVSSREKIAEIATILNHERSKDRIISVEGHSDNIGDPNYNLTLSSERADVVMKELVFSSIDQGRLSSLGKGENSPIADNSTREGRQANRRVEIVVHNPN